MIDYSFVLGVALSSFLICLVNIIYTFIQGRTDKTQNKLFITLYIFLALNSLTEIISGLYGKETSLSNSAFMVIQISKYIYFATHTALCPLFFYYVSNVSFVVR